MAPQMTSYGEGSQGMDAKLWGGLRNYIDLRMIYGKLPIESFFRLRQVCKEWNRLASDRGFLEESFRDPIPKPYFVVDSRKMGHRLLNYEASSRRWNWTRLPRANCEVAGLFCVYSQHSDSNRVFNVHTRVFHALPSPPEVPPVPLPEEEIDEPLIGMTVDTSVSPYSFQVFLGDAEIGTQIYDSKSGSWTQRPSTHEFAELSQGPEVEFLPKPTCIHCDGVLYIRVWGDTGAGVDLHTYNLEKDEWQCGVPWIPDEVWVFCDVGVWQDRVFTLRMMSESGSAIQALELTSTIAELELCDHSEDPWTAIDRMPQDLRSWLLSGEEAKLDEFCETIEMQSFFCGEYVLVYSCVGLEDVTERAVLYNLDRKAWEKVELPGPRRLVSSKAARAD